MAHFLAGTSLDQLKQQARHLRSSLAGTGKAISHGESLELLAHQHGYKNWNVLHAAVGNRQTVPNSRIPIHLGDVVEGRYLGRDFTGEVIGIAAVTGDRYRVTLNFDEPVDVVTFDSFSAFRKRVTCTVDRHGNTTEKTSDGRPHMQIRF